VYVLDAGNSLILSYNPDGLYRWALRGAEVPFSKPLGFAVNSEGEEVLVADTENNIVQKFTLR
jgi:DNA-binding beta-propeller fold protein YncE